MIASATDAQWVDFLRWALPRLHLRWAGFRKVRGQVCKRIRRRMHELGIESLEAYRSYLEGHAAEWDVLDAMCQISISRFFRDRGVFRILRSVVLPELADLAIARDGGRLRVWSAGCASGEEPYSMSILWRLAMPSKFAKLEFNILATDAAAHLIRRAEVGRYSSSSLKELPDAWRRRAFEEIGNEYCLKEPYRAQVEFRVQDMRKVMPQGPFDLILCRNLVFTYFDESRQHMFFRELIARLRLGGALVIGSHEQLPTLTCAVEPWSQSQQIFRKVKEEQH